MTNKKNVTRQGFVKNIAIIASGTFLAQLIPLIISPILTRIYSPEVLGYAGIYLATAAIVTSVATGRYEHAIILPSELQQARDLATLAIILSLGTSVLSLTAILILGHHINIAIGLPNDSLLIYLIPLSVIITSAYQVALYLNIREKAFSNVSKNRILQSTTVSLMQIGSAAIGLIGNGIVNGVLFGQALSIYYLGLKRGQLKTAITSTTPQKMKVALVRYAKFPKYDVPSTLLNIAANQLPTIMLGIYFSPAVAGFYYLTQRALQAPITLVAGSILDVFRQQAAQEQNDTGTIKKLYQKVFFALASMGIILTAILYFNIISLFSFVFGSEWKIAGEYAQLLLFPLALRLVANPLSFVFYVKEKQHYNLIGMALLFIFVIISIKSAATDLHAVKNLAVSYSIIYVLYIIASYRLSLK